jgi:hypothetical protein
VDGSGSRPGAASGRNSRSGANAKLHHGKLLTIALTVLRLNKALWLEERMLLVSCYSDASAQPASLIAESTQPTSPFSNRTPAEGRAYVSRSSASNGTHHHRHHLSSLSARSMTRKRHRSATVTRVSLPDPLVVERWGIKIALGKQFSFCVILIYSRGREWFIPYSSKARNGGYKDPFVLLLGLSRPSSCERWLVLVSHRKGFDLEDRSVDAPPGLT